MKALVLDEPGRLGIKEVPEPKVSVGRPLIKIKSAGICGSDVNAYKGKGLVPDLPLILGHEVAGEIVEAAPGSVWKPGDQVIVEPYLYCGECYPCSLGQRNCCETMKCLGVQTDGAMSEYITHPEDLLYRKPAEMPWDLAATVEPLTIATHGVHRVQAKVGEHVAIIGAGTIGILSALYLNYLGAVPILIDMMDSRLRIAHSLGVKYTVLSDGKTPVDAVMGITNGRGAEAVLETSGSVAGVEDTVQLASYAGRISLTGWPSHAPSLETPLITKKELVVFGSRCSAGEFPEAIDLVNHGAVNTRGIITKTVRFAELKEAVKAIVEDPQDYLKVIALFD